MKWGNSRNDDWTVLGAALPGTEAAVDAITRGSGHGLGGADPGFSPEKFTAWSETVFHRALKSWQTGNPEPLHPVMRDEVWDHYAQWLLFVHALPIFGTMMAAAQGTPAFVGAAADGGYHSALVDVAVDIHPPAGANWPLSGNEGQWRESWLFQRPATHRTGVAGAVSVCPVCGAPAEPEETGKCRYCHADITTRTSGWLVTRTATTMRSAKSFEQHIVAAPRPGTPAASGGLLQPPRAAPMQPPRA